MNYLKVCNKNLVFENFVNFIKSLKHKPTKLIPIGFYLAFLIFFAISYNIDPPSADRFKDPHVLIGLFTGILSLTMLFIIYSGISRDKFNFYMSDVNLVFTSPIKSQNVLLYGFIRQVSAILTIAVFLVFQIPMLTINFKFVSNGLLILLLILFLLFITLSFVSLLMYEIFSKYNKYKKHASNIAKYISIVIVALFGFYIYSLGGNILENTLTTLNNDFWNYIPIIG